MVQRIVLSRKHLSKWRDGITRILLAMLLFGAYVPVGYMPAAGVPFAVELCPGAAPALSVGMPMHHHHGSGPHAHFDACPFGSAPATGPATHVTAFAPPAPAPTSAADPFEPVRLGVRALRAHQPRGPPA